MAALPLTTSAAIEEIEFWDRTVEIVAYVEHIIPRKAAGRTELLKFFVCNGEGKRIQCVIWGADDINALENLIVKNQILHIDGAWARVPTRAEYNRGNVNFELQLFRRTTVTALGMYAENEEASEIDLVDLCDVIHYDSRTTIKVFGYIKTIFAEQHLGIGRQVGTFGCGSITNGTHKLEVRVPSFNNNPALCKGQPVFVTGKIEDQGPRIHLQVRSGEDIVISDEEVMPSVELIQGYRELKRAAEAENNEH